MLYDVFCNIFNTNPFEPCTLCQIKTIVTKIIIYIILRFLRTTQIPTPGVHVRCNTNIFIFEQLRLGYAYRLIYYINGNAFKSKK